MENSGCSGWARRCKQNSFIVCLRRVVVVGLRVQTAILNMSSYMIMHACGGWGDRSPHQLCELVYVPLSCLRHCSYEILNFPLFARELCPSNGFYPVDCTIGVPFRNLDESDE